MSVVRYYWGKMSNYNQFQNTYSFITIARVSPLLREKLNIATFTTVFTGVRR